MKKSFVYFMANKHLTVIYIGVTSDLIKRVYQHKTMLYKGFTTSYNCNMLVYFEEYDTINQAISREKQLKAWNRRRKEELIRSINPDWMDLSEGWQFNFS
jgi:putative endonuclease